MPLAFTDKFYKKSREEILTKVSTVTCSPGGSWLMLGLQKDEKTWCCMFCLYPMAVCPNIFDNFEKMTGPPSSDLTRSSCSGWRKTLATSRHMTPSSRSVSVLMAVSLHVGARLSAGMVCLKTQRVRYSSYCG